jgi:hypothetical protein
LAEKEKNIMANSPNEMENSALPGRAEGTPVPHRALGAS